MTKKLNSKSALNLFLTKKQLTISEDLYDRIIFLLEGSNEGLYDHQNIIRHILDPIIERNLEGDLRQFYLTYKNSFKKGVTLKKLQFLYGDEEGLKRWKKYCDLQAETNTLEYKKKKFGMTEEQFKEYNKSRSVTLENCIAKYGELKGQEFFENYCKKQQYAGCSLDYFIEKYGIIDGTEKYKTVNSRKAISLENMVRVHGEDEGRKRYETWREAATARINRFYSPVSQELFWQLVTRGVDGSMFAENGGEFGFYCKIDDKGYIYDFVVNSKKKVIEFNGDLYHANPEIYSAEHLFESYPYFGKTAKEIWDRDAHKNSKIIERGYSLLTVWEKDYRENPEKCILKCLEFIND